MRDVQSDEDKRNIPLDRVGVSDVSYPITVLDRERGTQQTVATVSMGVALPKNYRGTHMSRFVEAREEFQGKITPHDLSDFTEKLRRDLDANEVEAAFSFPYFVRKSSPVSKKQSWSRYDVTFNVCHSSSHFDFVTDVSLWVQTLCPCSKEISKYGAHNQRARVRVSVKMNKFVWIEELAALVEKCASAPTYTMLKREDEKYLTELAYETPRFVEDVAREAVIALEQDKRISWFSVAVKSYESIHSHNAFAEVKREHA